LVSRSTSTYVKRELLCVFYRVLLCRDVVKLVYVVMIPYC